MTLEQELDAANSRISALETQITGLTTENQDLRERHAAAGRQAQENFRLLNEARNQHTAETDRLNQHIADLEANQEDFETRLTAGINSGIQRHLESSGHPVIAAMVDTQPEGKPVKKDLSHLTGLQKAIAAHSSK